MKELMRRHKRLEPKSTALSSKQNRIRKNLEILGESREEKDLKRKYLGILMDDEKTLDRIREELETIAGTRDQLKITLNSIREDLLNIGQANRDEYY